MGKTLIVIVLIRSPVVGQQGGRNNTNRGQRKLKQQGVHRYTCRKCHKSHPGHNCHGDLLNCYECEKSGHKAYECPRKQNGNRKGHNGRDNFNGDGNGRNYNNHSNNNKAKNYNTQGENNGQNRQGATDGANNNNNGRAGNGRIYVMNQNEVDTNANVVT
ncbi:Replication protein A 70 kDa DNA-binding subunit C, partial [Bienertia sinuspersici]